MLTGRINGATRYLGAPANWRPEADGECAHLAIRDEDHGAGKVMVSAWMPTPAEIAAMQAGQPVYLHVWGSRHPPVALSVAPFQEASLA